MLRIFAASERTGKMMVIAEKLQRNCKGIAEKSQRNCGEIAKEPWGNMKMILTSSCFSSIIINN